MKIELLNFKNTDFNLNASYFVQSKEDSKGLVLVLPGAGYSFMGPCLYYPTNFLFDLGYNILNIEYDFRWKTYTGTSKEDYASLMKFLDQEVENIKQDKELIILAKSIGTRFLATSKLQAYKYIWLTPALKDDFVKNAIQVKDRNSLVIIGDKDPFYDEETLSLIQNKLIISGADHGLDIEKDINKSLDGMKNIIQNIGQFLKH